MEDRKDVQDHAETRGRGECVCLDLGDDFGTLKSEHCPLHGLRASAPPREDKPAPKPFVRGQKINIQNAPSSLETSVAEWNRTKWIGGR